MTGVVIVGAGQAGAQVAAKLREGGYESDVTLLGAEGHPPYQRPPLSKGYLDGSTDGAGLLLRKDTYWESRDISVAWGERALEIDPARSQVTTQIRDLDYDHLVLATGSRPRRLQVPGHDLDNILYLRTLDDARRCVDAFATAKTILVVGGGFIGLEIAAFARGKGKDVQVIEMAPRLLGRAVPPLLSDFFLEAHRSRGVEVRLGTTLDSFEGRDGRVVGAWTSDGYLTADLVMVGVGALPRSELASAAGLLVDRGIVVDEHARTSHPSVLAAGDCTSFRRPGMPDELLSLESVQHAVDQANVVAATILGRDEPYTATPWFWSFQGDLKLQIAGLHAGADRFVIRGELASEHFSVLHYASDTLAAAFCVNQPADFMAVRRALSSGQNIDPDKASDPGVPLKELIA